MATRSCIDEPFGQPVRMDAVNSTADDRAPSLSRDGRTLFFASNRPGNMGFDIMAVDLQTPLGPGSPPRFLSLPNVNSFADEITPFPTADGSALYFASNRPEATGGFDIYFSNKLTDGSFDWPTEEVLINSTGDDTSP